MNTLRSDAEDSTRMLEGCPDIPFCMVNCALLRTLTMTMAEAKRSSVIAELV
jgi:hypothetical protein